MLQTSRTAVAVHDSVAFSSVEEAWIWAVQGMVARLEGAKVLSGMASIIRPCEASDVIACAYRLHREGTLTAIDLQVLFLYGRHAIAPRSLGGRHRNAIPVWQRALCRLEELLEQKGIIIGQSVGRAGA